MDISNAEAMVLYQTASKIAISDNITLFEADLFGRRKIVKIKFHEDGEFESSIHEIDGNLYSRILSGERASSVFQIIEK